MPEMTAAGPVLVHFFDVAQLNSVRSIPYVVEWHHRYAGHGLTVLGVHSPRFPFTKPEEAIGAGVDGWESPTPSRRTRRTRSGTTTG